MIAWFIAPYKRRVGAFRPTRYCAMDDFTSLVRAKGGDWSESEVLGNRAIVKIRASAATITTIAATAGFKRLPKDLLTASLADLTTSQKNALKNEALDMGYTLAEIQARFPNDLGQYTLGDVLRFFATRRLKPRYDSATDSIILDGPVQECKTISQLDIEV